MPRSAHLLVAGLLALAGCEKSKPAAPAEARPAAAAPAAAPAPAPAATGEKVVRMEVTDDGFVPAKVEVKQGQPLTLLITRKTDQTCATEILIEGTELNVPLPLNQETAVKFTPGKPGTLKFGCHMDKMVGGTLVID